MHPEMGEEVLQRSRVIGEYENDIQKIFSYARIYGMMRSCRDIERAEGDELPACGQAIELRQQVLHLPTIF